MATKKIGWRGSRRSTTLRWSDTDVNTVGEVRDGVARRFRKARRSDEVVVQALDLGASQQPRRMLDLDSDEATESAVPQREPRGEVVVELREVRQRLTRPDRHIARGR